MKNNDYTVKKIGHPPRPGGFIHCPHCQLEIHKWRPGEMNCPHCGGKIKISKGHK